MEAFREAFKAEAEVQQSTTVHIGYNLAAGARPEWFECSFCVDPGRPGWGKLDGLAGAGRARKQQHEWLLSASTAVWAKL